MNGRARLLAVVASALLALLSVPAGASAAVMLGETFKPGTGSNGDTTLLQTVSPSDQYAAPFAGVITSWSHRATDSPFDLPDLKLKVARPFGGASYTIVGESPVQTLALNELNSFPVHIPVQQGDVIGLYVATLGHVFTSTPPGYAYGSRDGDVPPGSTEAFGSATGLKLDVSARLEPYRCAGRNATLAGTEGNDVLVGTPGDDVIVGLDGRDKIKGVGGKDRICAGKGKDRLKGGGGKDVLKGAKGKDRLAGGGGRDKCVGGKGKDTAKQCETERSVP